MRATSLCCVLNCNKSQFNTLRVANLRFVSQRAFCLQVDIGFRWTCAVDSQNKFCEPLLLSCVLNCNKSQFNTQAYRSGHKRVARLKMIDYHFQRVKPPKERSSRSEYSSDTERLFDGGGRSLDEKSFESALA